MNVEEFVNRMDEAEKVLKYTFRLNFTAADQEQGMAAEEVASQERGLLVEAAAEQAYRMFAPFVSDRWNGHPFLTNRVRLDELNKNLDIGIMTEFHEKRKNMLIKDAIVSIYCMVREIIGEENRITVYASGEYAFFDEEAFAEEKETEQEKKNKKKKRKNLSKYITGMDDLLERGVYHKFGEGKNPLKVEKDHVEASRAEFLRSRNQPLKRSIKGLDKKLAEVPGYKTFIKNKEVNVKGEIVHREFLNISDLDVMAIFRRSSSRWNVIEKIEKSNNDNIDLDMERLQELNGLYKSLNQMESLRHMTAADKLYVQVQVEKILNYNMMVCLWKNISELANSRANILLFDAESIETMSDCFKMSNVVCRAEVVNMEFDGLRDYKELQEKKENCTMDTWKTELQDVFGKTIARQNDEQDLFNLNRWKAVYKEDIDSWTNWVFPLFLSCFCVALRKNIEKNMEEKGQNIVCRMYNELSEYIKKKDVKLEIRMLDENDMRELEQNTIMLKALSGYVSRAIETAQEVKAPITLEELDTMMPKKKDYYLKYSKLQFLRRNEVALAGGMRVIKFTI
jgi:hypothetical protein